MIVDTLENAARYAGTAPRMEEAFRFLQKLAAEAPADGRYEGDDGIYATVSSYTAKQYENARMEFHRQYADIQYILSGTESIWVPLSGGLAVTQPFTEGKDCAFTELPKKCGCSRAVLEAGQYAVLFPGELHAPGVEVGHQAAAVRKIVIKVPM